MSQGLLVPCIWLVVRVVVASNMRLQLPTCELSLQPFGIGLTFLEQGVSLAVVAAFGFVSLPEELKELRAEVVVGTS